MLTLFDPEFDNFSKNAFGLGFFAAISVQASGVTIDLNGKTLEQSPEHALMQRYFALIELASSPFIQSVGPAQFVGEDETFEPANNIVIKGPGTLGRSAHHGIHGNENSNVVITKITFTDFEVAAVSLNKVNYLTIADNEIKQNRHDVPVVGAFSAARFIRPYLMKLKKMKYKMMLRGEEVEAKEVLRNLMKSIKNVYRDVSKEGFINKNKHPEEFRLFDNPHRVVDVHGKGPAVAGFADFIATRDNDLSRDIFIENNTIENIVCWNNEVPAAIEDGRPANDVRGAILQFEKTLGSGTDKYLAINEDGTYKGNVVADAQIMVAKAVLDGVLTSNPEMQTAPNSINQNIVDWAAGTGSYVPQYRCNGDSMHHVIKGITVIRVDDVVGFSINGNSIKNVKNLSEKPFDNCYDYHTTSEENQGEQQLGNIRMISTAAACGYRFLGDDDESGTVARAFNVSSLFPPEDESGVTIAELEKQVKEAQRAHETAQKALQKAENQEARAQTKLQRLAAKSLVKRGNSDGKWQTVLMRTENLAAANESGNANKIQKMQERLDRAQERYEDLEQKAVEAEANLSIAKEAYDLSLATLEAAKAAEEEALEQLVESKSALEKAKEAIGAVSDGEEEGSRRFLQRSLLNNAGAGESDENRSLRSRMLESKPLVERTSAALSEISGNAIEAASSSNGCRTIGIDIQGTSREMEIDGNEVKLKPSDPGVDECHTGLRIRSSVPLTDFVETDNNFEEGIYQEKAAATAQSAVILPDGHPRCTWTYGSPPGCPFAR
ncbi:MAG: hypothetical protein SGILL_005619 [Bacillariaceae sp.]